MEFRSSVLPGKTVTKYVLQEMTGPFLLGLLIFTFVLLMDKLLDLIEYVISKGVSLNVVLELVLYIMPSFLVLTIPMAVLVATLTAFGRLSTDSEIIAMKASGISLYSLFVPVVSFAVIACGLTFFLYTKALPWGNHNFRVTLYELARTKASIGLKEHVFNDAFRGLVIYIDEISDADNTFKGIMISDSRDQQNPQVIFAKKGRLITDEKALRVILRLEDGATHPKQIITPLKYQIGEFPSLDILLSFQEEGETGISIPRTDRDMTISQLHEQYVKLKQQDKRLSSPYLVELHKRFSIPFACIIFGLIGTPLGIQSKRAGKSGGYAISVFLLLIYYIFITAGESLGDDGKLPVFLAVWTPNVLLGSIGILLLIRMARR